jgi:thiol-disulfide isomerase/thioredoxin
MKSSFQFRVILSIAVLLVLAGGAQAELMVGDKAPKLQTGQWIQGEPVTGFDSNHIYVVEFWATWCGPCVGSIPHLNQMWEKFKDKGVIVIGQDAWESDDGVAPFVKKMGTNMTYRVALDDKSHDKDGFMASNWWPRSTTEHHGIPTAFIINRNGIIAWIGHPLTLDEHEEILTAIVSGNYDMAKAVPEYKVKREQDIKFISLQQKLYSACDSKDWNAAENAFNEIPRLFPTNELERIQADFADAHVEFLLGQKKYGEAYQLAESVSTAKSNRAGWQESLAWVIASSDEPKPEFLDLAEKICNRSLQLTDGKDVSTFHTLARVQFMLGKKAAAIATEEKAISLSENKWKKETYSKTLSSYQEDKLPDPTR